MGLTPGDDFETGIACPRCFDPSNPVGLQVTPKHVQLIVAGVISCPAKPAPPNGTWILTQTFACVWAKVTAAYNFGFVSSVLFGGNMISLVDIFNQVGGGFFFRDKTDECSTEFSNEQVLADCLVGVAGHDGTVTVSWGPGIGP